MTIGFMAKCPQNNTSADFTVAGLGTLLAVRQIGIFRPLVKRLLTTLFANLCLPKPFKVIRAMPLMVDGQQINCFTNLCVEQQVILEPHHPILRSKAGAGGGAALL